MKKSILALAVSLLAVSAANAAVDGRAVANGGASSNFTGGSSVADSVLNGKATVNGGGEFLFAAFNDSKSYALDLGIRFDSIYDGDVANGTTWNLANFNLSGGDSFMWNVGALSGRTTYLNPTTITRSRYGVITTVGSEQTAASFSTTNLGGAIGKMTAQNVILSQSDIDYGINNSYVANTNTDTNYLGHGDYGNSYGGQFLFSTSGINGSVLELQFIGLNAAGQTRVSEILGTFTLNGNILTYNTPAEVPVPAAAWLMGSALLGLGAVGRRRAKQA
jgi:hypothetical protein